MAEKWPYEKDAHKFEESEHDVAKMRRVQVNRHDPKSSLAVRFDTLDLERLRARAEAEGVGVTQLVRRWVIERLDEPESSGSVEDLLAALEESMRAARAIKRSGGRKVG